MRYRDPVLAIFLGLIAAACTPRGDEVTVIDHQPLNTWITEEVVDGFGFRYVHNDIENAPAPDGTDLGVFDFAIMTHVIPHLAWRPDRALRHVASLTDDGADRGPFS